MQAGGSEESEVAVQVAAHYCQEFVHPLGWVHNLKSTHDMMEVFHLAQSCTDVKPAVR